jgi:cytochrome P450
MTTAAVDLSDFALWRNGFPDDVFAELRRARPLFRHGITPGVAKTVQRDFWVATKHRHAVRLHRDAESFTAVDGPLIQPVDMFASYPTIINMDPPALNKRRRLITSAFNPRAIAKLEDGIRARAAGMVDHLLIEGGGDWIEDVADALPMTVIGDIIGIPDEDRPRIFDSLDRILKARSPGARLSQKDEVDLYATIFGYAMELTAEKRRSPADDIWSTLASAIITGEDGDEFSLPANELEFFFFVLTFAGSDTTKNALATGLQAFVANPEQIERYREDDTLRSGAVEEVLRWAVSTFPRAPGWSRCCGRPTATRRFSTRRSPSTSLANPIRTWRSVAAAHTIASARCWRVQSCARCSTNCCCGAMTSTSARPPRPTRT